MEEAGISKLMANGEDLMVLPLFKGAATEASPMPLYCGKLPPKSKRDSSSTGWFKKKNKKNSYLLLTVEVGDSCKNWYTCLAYWHMHFSSTTIMNNL